eukprot:13436771-Alexandrium_andersonii.AAC.1
MSTPPPLAEACPRDEVRQASGCTREYDRLHVQSGRADRPAPLQSRMPERGRQDHMYYEYRTAPE